LDKASAALYHFINRRMEKEPVEGERPDGFCSGGYWIGGEIDEE
jgi:hypothetical protein